MIAVVLSGTKIVVTLCRSTEIVLNKRSEVWYSVRNHDFVSTLYSGLNMGSVEAYIVDMSIMTGLVWEKVRHRLVDNVPELTVRDSMSHWVYISIKFR